MEKELLRRVNEQDLGLLRDFIRHEWDPNHVLAKSKKLFDWQYLNSLNSRYNFFVAFVDDKITGMLGYTTNSQYDSSLDDHIGWLSMWKVSQRALPGQGLRLLKLVENEIGGKAIGTIGCNERVHELYKRLGFNTGFLSHLYVPASNHPVGQIKLCEWPIEDTSVSEDGSRIVLISPSQRELITRTISKFEDFLPFGKSVNYYIGRYLDCPFYRYIFGQILDSEANLAGFLVFRVVADDHFQVIRILEIVSDRNALKLRSALTKLNDTLHSQFADFYIFSSGKVQDFDLLEVDASLNIPNLFEPLKARRKLLRFAVKSIGEEPLTLSRGDCDQDRPNQI